MWVGVLVILSPDQGSGFGEQFYNVFVTVKHMSSRKLRKTGFFRVITLVVNRREYIKTVCHAGKIVVTSMARCNMHNPCSSFGGDEVGKDYL